MASGHVYPRLLLKNALRERRLKSGSIDLSTTRKRLLWRHAVLIAFAVRVGYASRFYAYNEEKEPVPAKNEAGDSSHSGSAL